MRCEEGMRVGVVVVLLLVVFVREGEAVVGLTGSSQKCDNDGEVVPLPGSIDSPCFTCMCRGTRVECERQDCPNLQGCFLIALGQREGCCGVCKGCKVGNSTYSSGSELTEGCSKQTCVAGVLTRSRVNCYVPCSNPIAPTPGSCCPTCSGCSLNGREYKEGEEGVVRDDPCVRCKCKGGSMECVKTACPVLSCPAGATYLESGECCPKCNGSRTRFIPKRICLVGDKAYASGSRFSLDICTNCTCVENTAVCRREACGALECEAGSQVTVQGACCPECREREVTRSECVQGEAVYKNGQVWDVSACRSCMCDWGKVRCTEQLCPKNLQCGSGQRIRKVAGKCCAECVGEDGVCTVFGDPHYRSFDGRLFNFQGACKYVLAADCRDKTFAVRVRNDARESRAFSWTRTVTLKVREGRVTLGQRMRIKVNGKRIAMPYSHGSLSIRNSGDLAVVESSVGVKLVWDGDSFVEVSVPYSYRGRVCGLCGNFNGNRTDDFVVKNRGVLGNSSVFGESWRVGGKKSCSRGEEVKSPEPCRKNWKARVKAEKACSPLRTPDYEMGVFAPCHKTVSMGRFFKSCTFDMCECPVGRKCQCEVFTAYARACERAGITIDEWRERTGCSYKKRWRRS